MAKRFVGIFFFLILIFSFLSARVYVLMSDINGTARQAIANQQKSVINIYKSRGIIYDCNLNALVENTDILKAVVDPFSIDNAESVLNLVSQENKTKTLELLREGRPFCTEVIKAQEINGVKIFDTSKRYQEPYICSHTIGYIDSQSKGAIGIEKAFDIYLDKESSSLNAIFAVDAKRRALSGLGFITEGQYNKKKDGIVLTIDKNLQEIAEKAANLYLESGAIVILDIDSGEIKAMLSRPNFNPYDLSIAGENVSFINKALNTYNVGSVFKIAVTAAFLQNGGTDEEFFCNGGIQVGRNYISCQNGERHGKVNLEKGFSQSCNVYFIELAKKITAQKLYETVISLGFNEEITLADGLVSKKSNLPTLKNLSSKTALANLSIGQGELLATPLQIARLVSVVAGDGTLKTPYLVKGFLDEKGVITSYDKTLISNQVITSQTANRIKGLMISTALNGTGLRANPDRGGAGVKTATAQTGIKKDGKDVIQAWIGGFFPSALPKYAVAILVENGISGGRSGGPIFKYIAENGYDYIKSNTLLN